MAQAVSDSLLSLSDSSSQRFYSLSSQILTKQNIYYEVINKAQCDNGNITEWLDWFLNCIYRALKTSQETMRNLHCKTELQKDTQQHTLPTPCLAFLVVLAIFQRFIRTRQFTTYWSICPLSNTHLFEKKISFGVGIIKTILIFVEVICINNLIARRGEFKIKAINTCFSLS